MAVCLIFVLFYLKRTVEPINYLRTGDTIDRLSCRIVVDDCVDQLIAVNVTGIPLLLTYQQSWDCRNLRHHIWLNFIRFLWVGKTDILRSTRKSNNQKCSFSDVATDVFNALLSRDVIKQIKMSGGLPIRLVDSNGRSLYSKYSSTEKYKSTEYDVSDFNSDVLQHVVSMGLDMHAASSANNKNTAEALHLRQIWYQKIQNVLCEIAGKNPDTVSLESLFGSSLPTKKGTLFGG